MKFFSKYLFNSVLYKAVCICAFMMVPSIVFCFFPQAVSIILLLWGALFLLRDLKYKNFLRQTGSVFLLLFCLGYIITLVLYAENDLVSTIHIFCWAIVEFFLLFSIDRNRDTAPEAMLKDMYQINAMISVVGFLTGVVSLIFFFRKVSVVMPDPEGLNNYWSMGIVNGRNSGVFNNAIPCANAMFISFAAALFNLLHDEKKSLTRKIFYIVTMVVCYLVILTTLTRTFVYGVYIFMFVLIVSAGFQRIKGDKLLGVKKAIVTIAMATICVALLFCATEISKKMMEKAVADVSINSIIINAEGFNKNSDAPTAESPTTSTAETSTESPATSTTEASTESIAIATSESSADSLLTPSENTAEATYSQEEIEKQISDKLGLSASITLERNELERLPSFLYPRDELWQTALEVIPHSPVFGFTSGNRNSSSLEYSTSEYIAQYWSSGIPTYHNAYFDIAVSSGLLGLGLLLAFLAIQIVRTLRTLFTKELDVQNKRRKWAFGVLVSYLTTHVFVTCMFFGVLCFSNISVCLYFWTVMGYVSIINDKCDDGTSKFAANTIVGRVLKINGAKYE